MVIRRSTGLGWAGWHIDKRGGKGIVWRQRLDRVIIGRGIRVRGLGLTCGGCLIEIDGSV